MKMNIDVHLRFEFDNSRNSFFRTDEATSPPQISACKLGYGMFGIISTYSTYCIIILLGESKSKIFLARTMTQTRTSIILKHNRLTMSQSNTPEISPELCKQLVQMYTPADDTSKRIPKETARAVSEVIKLMVLEARSRALIIAECDAVDDDEGQRVEIRADHVTKIAESILADFS